MPAKARSQNNANATAPAPTATATDKYTQTQEWLLEKRRQMDQIDKSRILREHRLAVEDNDYWSNRIRQEVEEEGGALWSYLFGPRFNPNDIMYYVIFPIYVPYDQAVNASVFLTTNKKSAIRVLDFLNSLPADNSIIQHIHNIAKDTIDREPIEYNFRIIRYTPNFMRIKTSVPIENLKLDFLLLDGLINQDIDKVASSLRNDTHFNAQHLNALRTISNDKHFV